MLRTVYIVRYMQGLCQSRHYTARLQCSGS